MTVRAFRAMLVLLVSATLLTACWGRRELESVTFVTAVAVDRGRTPGNLRVTVQTANPSLLAPINPGQPGGPRSPVVVHAAEAATFGDAMQRLNTTSPRPLNFSHMRVILLGEDLARDGVGRLLDTWLRFIQFRDTAYAMVTRGEAGPYLSLLTDLERDPGDFLRQLLVAKRRFGTAPPTQLRDLVLSTILPGFDAVVPYLELHLDPGTGSGQQLASPQGTTLTPPASLEHMVARAAVFRDARMVGLLSPEETQIYLILRGLAQNQVVSIPMPGQPDNLVTVLLKAGSVRTRVNVDPALPTARLSLRLEGLVFGISEPSAELLTDPEGLKLLQSALRDEMRERALTFIRRTQTEFKADVLGIGRSAQRRFPTVQAWEAYRWVERYPDVVVDVDVLVWLRRRGLNLAPPRAEGGA